MKKTINPEEYLMDVSMFSSLGLIHEGMNLARKVLGY